MLYPSINSSSAKKAPLLEGMDSKWGNSRLGNEVYLKKNSKST